MKCLIWYGHVKQMLDDHWSKKLLNSIPHEEGKGIDEEDHRQSTSMRKWKQEIYSEDNELTETSGEQDGCTCIRMD